MESFKTRYAYIGENLQAAGILNIIGLSQYWFKKHLERETDNIDCAKEYRND
ncbi:MAG TPA: hypothetical protein VN278_01775 [Methanosarcina sp.]|nr:hypothetical protein [Methanosarcina sp.]